MKEEIIQNIDKLPEELLPELHNFLLFLLWREAQTDRPASPETEEDLREMLNKRWENHLENPEAARPAEEVIADVTQKFSQVTRPSAGRA